MILFWRPYEAYGFLSQWYMSDFALHGITFNCCEQYMMYHKAILFNDIEVAERILKSTSPYEIKRLGRLVKNFNKAIWEQNVENIIYECNLAKFKQNTTLGNLLRETAGYTLVEASPYDHLYGIGLLASDPRAADEKQWLGHNRLGRVLMKVRDNLG